MSATEWNTARRVGERVRRTRLAARRQQTVVAGLAGITTDYLYQIERGLKLPSVTVLVELARVLNVPVAVLLGEAPTPDHPKTSAVVRPRLPSPQKPMHAFDAIPTPGSVALGGDLYQAMTTRPVDRSDAAALGTLGDRVAGAWRVWQGSPRRYSELSAAVPALVSETERQLRLSTGGTITAERREAARYASSLYCLLRSFCKRVGRMELALLAADRAIRAAELADDPVRLAAGKWNLSHVLLADGEVAGAEDAAMSGVDELRHQMANDASAELAALCGSLLLVGSMAAVRRGDAWTARARVEDAGRLAEMTGERNTCGTVFGPTNVAMHAASVELMAGQAAEGLRLAEQVDHRASPSIERRVAFLLDQATAWRQKRDNAQVLLLLMETEREAPEDMRYRPAARDLVGHLVEHGRRPVAEQAAQMAERLQLTV